MESSELIDVEKIDIYLLLLQLIDGDVRWIILTIFTHFKVKLDDKLAY